MVELSERRRSRRWPAALIVVAGFTACLAANYPGHFTSDSVWQLAQGREGLFNDWHPPVMAWLLGLADRLVPHAGLFMILDAGLFYGGLMAFAGLEPRPRPIGLAMLALWMISPLTMIYQGVVLKDVLFADAAMAGFAALAWAGRAWERPVARWALLGLAAMLFVLAGLTRQNGLIAPFFGALGLAGVMWLREPRAVRPAAVGAAGFLLMLLLVSGVTQALRATGDGLDGGLHHLNILQVWDLAGATRRQPDLPLPALHVQAPEVEAFIRRSAAPVYRSAGVDNIVTLPGGVELTNPPDSLAGRDWLRLIRTRPGLYLDLRARVWLDTLLTPTAARCPMIFLGIVDDDPAILRRAGLALRDDDRDDWDGDYVTVFLRTPLFSHLFYGAVILVVLGVTASRWRRGVRDPGLVVGAAMGLAGVAFAASFFVVSVDCDYRFLYFLDVAAMALAVRAGCAREPHGTR